MADEPRPKRKRRTRAHVIAGLSQNHLERKVLLRGHVLFRPADDYGVDATMFHFAGNGQIENGEVRFQLKASDKLRLVNKASMVVLSIETGDLHYWSMEIYPFVLVVYDAKNDKAYWLHIQQYVTTKPNVGKLTRKSLNVRILVSNELTDQSIDTFRKMSLERIKTLRTQGRIRDVLRKKPK